jgi:hypothetical protein
LGDKFRPSKMPQEQEKAQDYLRCTHLGNLWVGRFSERSIALAFGNRMAVDLMFRCCFGVFSVIC